MITKYDEWLLVDRENNEVISSHSCYTRAKAKLDEMADAWLGTFSIVRIVPSDQYNFEIVEKITRVVERR